MRSLTFLVVTWHWSLALCRAKPQLLIIASGIFSTCHTLVPHVIEGCLMYLSMPNSTLPKSSPQCPQKVNVTLFFGQNLICLAFYLGLCLVLSFVGDYVSWEERGVLFTSSISRCPYAHLFSHSFIHQRLHDFTKEKRHVLCLEVSRQTWSQKKRTLNKVG